GIVHVIALGRGEGNVQGKQEVVGLAGRYLHAGGAGPAQVHSARRLARLCLCIHWLPPSQLLRWRPLDAGTHPDKSRSALAVAPSWSHISTAYTSKVY